MSKKKYYTVATHAVDMRVGMQFVDTNGAVYTVQRIQLKQGVHCVYATTDSKFADGWFTRNAYDVLPAEKPGKPTVQITISGDLGSGKSTIGEMLAKYYDAELVDCGQLYRQYAESKGRDVLGQNKSGDQSIDEKIDQRLIEMGKEGKSRIYVSRTAWHFIPNAKHVYLCVDPMVAARRIAARKTVGEEHADASSVLLYNMERVHTEDIRYLRMYGITRVQQLKDADVVMQIGEESAETVFNALRAVLEHAVTKCYVAPPTNLVPTQVLHDMSPQIVAEYEQTVVGTVRSTSINLSHTPIGTFIQDGHHRVAAACLNKVKYLVTDKVRFDDNVGSLMRKSDYYDWEDAYGFNLRSVSENEAELLWCRANAPEAFKDFNDQDLLMHMRDSYISYLCVKG